MFSSGWEKGRGGDRSLYYGYLTRVSGVNRPGTDDVFSKIDMIILGLIVHSCKENF